MNTAGITRFFESDKKLAVDEFMLLLGKDTDLVLLYSYFNKDSKDNYHDRSDLKYSVGVLKYAGVYDDEAFNTIIDSLTDLDQLSALGSKLSDGTLTYIGNKVNDKIIKRVQDLKPNLAGVLGSGTTVIDKALLGKYRDNLIEGMDNIILMSRGYGQYNLETTQDPYGYRRPNINCTMDSLEAHAVFQPWDKIMLMNYQIENGVFKLGGPTVASGYLDVIADLPYQYKYTKVTKVLDRVSSITTSVDFMIDTTGDVAWELKTQFRFSPYTKQTTISAFSSMYREEIKSAVEAKITQQLSKAFPTTPKIEVLTAEQFYSMITGKPAVVPEDETTTEEVK